MRSRRESEPAGRVAGFGRALAVLAVAGSACAMAGCAGPSPIRSADGRVWDPKLGVWSSPRLVADGEAVPRGGGSYLTGRPYVIGGRTYYPTQNPSGYSAVGTASWYGDAFHGRRTANGEIFDKGSISAAHPTLPLPSYVRVTNLKNGRSMVVRVNDRGPYHGGRVMDVSQRVADALQFRGEGTAHVRVDYLGRAALQGSDDATLLASLRTDGTPAQMDGLSGSGAVVMTADTRGGGTLPVAPPPPLPAQREPDPVIVRDQDLTDRFARRGGVPLPPPRPFTLGQAGEVPPSLPATRTEQRAAVVQPTVVPLAYAATGSMAAPSLAMVSENEGLPFGAERGREP
jgi:rare lipoprotein A